MNIPRATVRLQLHGGFGFDDAAATVDHYARLGISHFYLSPIFAAREGSTHGYDVVDPTRVNPELGGEAGFLRLVEALRSAGMGLVIDIVPNHMGVASVSNAYWQDVLQWGPSSPYAGWFDIDWQTPNPRLQGKLLLPVLGQSREAVLRAGDIRLQFDAAEGRFQIACYGNLLPVAAPAYAALLASEPALADIAPAFATVQPPGMPAACQQLAAWVATPTGQHAMAKLLARHSPATAAGQQALHEVLELQHYRLSGWRNAAEEINWRRFFEVSELAGVRAEQADVFEATHSLIFGLYARGLIDGVRVDHVDGLADPAAYCRQLRERLRQLQPQRPPDLPTGDAWLLVEKILSPGEGVPAEWSVDGSTGYDFMDQVGAVLHDPQGEQALRGLWAELTGDTHAFEQHLQSAREQLLAENFVGELTALARAVHRYAQSGPLGGRDVAEPAIHRVLAALLACFRRYRCYTTPQGSSAADRDVLARAVGHARRHLRAPDHALLDEVASWLGLADSPLDLPDGHDEALRQRAITRFQQLTPPLAAKAMEDTVFYRFAPLLSRNEVGSYPAQVAPSLAAFHASNAQRAAHAPRSMLATATHDHKRGEDTRARLAVLSELHGQWGSLLRSWMARHHALRATLPQPGGGLLTAPAPADELMLYQSLFGAWPPGLESNDRKGLDALGERVAAWQQKSLREAKQHSSWMHPHADYEAACRDFLTGLLQDATFTADMAGLVTQLAPAAAANAMAQTLLRLTSPGVPDLYQGTDLADFSLVDPDNRRPVDMALRRAVWAEAWPAGGNRQPGEWLQSKQQLIHKALEARQTLPELFCGGDYLPLEAIGPLAGHVLAFARRAGSSLAITLTLRHPARLFAAFPDALIAWADTLIELPAGFSHRWRNALDGRQLDTGDAALRVADALEGAVVALLMANG